jgi:hypothetical protein
MIKLSPARAPSCARWRLCSALLAVVLASCVAAAPAPGSPADLAQSAMARGDYATAAIQYQAAARGAAPGFAGDYWLLAAQASLQGHDPAGADAILDRVPPGSLDSHQLARMQLQRAQAALAQHDPGAALRARHRGRPIRRWRRRCCWRARRRISPAAMRWPARSHGSSARLFSRTQLRSKTIATSYGRT